MLVNRFEQNTVVFVKLLNGEELIATYTYNTLTKGFTLKKPLMVILDNKGTTFVPYLCHVLQNYTLTIDESKVLFMVQVDKSEQVYTVYTNATSSIQMPNTGLIT